MVFGQGSAVSHSRLGIEMILVASADPTSWHRVKEALKGIPFAVSFSVDVQGTLEFVDKHHPDLIVLWSSLLDADIDEALGYLRQHAPETRVVVVSEDRVARATDDASRSSVRAHINEQEVDDALIEVVRKALEDRESEAERPDPDTVAKGARSRSLPNLNAYRNMVMGKSERLRNVMRLAGKVAAVDANVLITGETGTGKEVLARWIHCASSRAREPFEVVDLPSIPADLFESILFGHERGSFTGAISPKKGSFQRAHGGTLFLDEVSNLRLELQPKLLRAIQEKEVISVGGRDRISCDVRIVSASNVDLEDAVRRGQFRSDLFFRLNVVSLHLPPLRERRDELPALLDFFVKKYARSFRCEAPTVTSEAFRALQGHDWPGNIRELQNRVQRAILLSQSDRLYADDFFTGECLCGNSSAVHFGNCDHSLAKIEQQYISHVLERTRGNRSQAAQILQISRKTLHNKLQAYARDDASPQQKERAIRSVS
jgi:DNA-binding NtrC family response regulator